MTKSFLFAENKSYDFKGEKWMKQYFFWQILFGTGDQEKAITVTANSGFVRAAKQSGVIYSVFHHEARALSEIKEKH